MRLALTDLYRARWSNKRGHVMAVFSFQSIGVTNKW